ncbi:MAG TPA: DUF4115 domain-containing protein [Acidimicrobiales bacterium]|nr:DUF4115 domain-containing protein [Acidimicrobiales bacterium]
MAEAFMRTAVVVMLWVAVGLGMAPAMLRRPRRERRSADDFRRGLEVLGRLPGPAASTTTPRRSRSDPSPSEAIDTSPGRLAGRSGPEVGAINRKPLRLDGPRYKPRKGPSGLPPRPLERPRRRTPLVRSWGEALAAVVALAVLGLGVLAVTGGGGSKPTASSSTSTTAAPATNVRPASGHRQAAAPKAKKGGPTTTTTTAPGPLAPASFQSGQATWKLPPGTSAVSVATTSGACWVEVRSPQTGPVVFVGTLAPGDSHTFAVGSGLWIRLGNSVNAQVTAGPHQLALPNVGAEPLNLVVTTG